MVSEPLSLDLSQLQGGDGNGIQRLRELASSGVVLRGASTYVQWLLKNGGQER